MEVSIKESKEKSKVAFTSILAAIFLTISKLVVGLVTGSLGIISEALHSGLDLIAAIMTFFSVKIADKPPDKQHNYGHGKIENLSALFQTLLLLFTCFWIVYEAYQRLTGSEHQVDVNVWSFAVIIVSIIIDIGRSRALMKTAKKYNSQALEADALHFASDILSSAVVIFGLIGAYLGFPEADAISALIVAVIVIIISLKLGKKSIDALIDKTPNIPLENINKIVEGCEHISEVHNIKARASGSNVFIDLNIHINGNKTLIEAHQISHNLEAKIKEAFPKTFIHIHIEPDKDTHVD